MQHHPPTLTLAAEPPATVDLSGLLLALVDVIPGGALTVLAGLALLALAAARRLGLTRRRTPGPTGSRGTLRTMAGLLKGGWRAAKFLARWVGGRELRGEPKSTATAWTMGKPLNPKPPKPERIDLEGLVPRVSLVKQPKTPPAPWARRAASWLRTYDGRGTWALDRAQRLVRGVRRAYAAATPVVTVLARTASSWSCWPYAARGATRVAGIAALLGLAVPAWRLATLITLTLGAALAVEVARRHPPKPPTDADTYGPRLWTVLRADLGLPEDEPQEQWLRLPDVLTDPYARITLRLPDSFRADDTARERATALVNMRLPGDWVATWRFVATTHYVVTWRPKPEPKPAPPAPEPPRFVDQAGDQVTKALADLPAASFIAGADENGSLIVRKMSGESSHWALSVGSGGGKSATMMWLAVQMLLKRGTIIGVDPKGISLKALDGVEGVHLYNDPENGRDMRKALEWVADVTSARFFEFEQGWRTEFQPLYLILEESNELATLLKAVWSKVRVKSGEDRDQAGDPIWEEAVAKILRLGRAVNVHIVAVFQDFKDNQFGGTSLQPLFRVKMLGNYDPRQWERITGMSKTVMPPNVEIPGRMVMISEGKPLSFQVPYVSSEEEGKKGEPAPEAESFKIYHRIYMEIRDRLGYEPQNLYSTPPTPSPKGVPALLRDHVEALSRDESPISRLTALEGGRGDETAGRVSRSEGDVTALEGDVTGQRDALRLIPGQGGDPTAPPELLPLAEVARRLEDVPEVPSADTMRAHKRRRGEDFPKGIMQGKKELYTVDQIRAYYAQEAKRA